MGFLTTIEVNSPAFGASAIKKEILTFAKKIDFEVNPVLQPWIFYCLSSRSTVSVRDNTASNPLCQLQAGDASGCPVLPLQGHTACCSRRRCPESVSFQRRLCSLKFSVHQGCEYLPLSGVLQAYFRYLAGLSSQAWRPGSGELRF